LHGIAGEATQRAIGRVASPLASMRARHARRTA
jgi:hypothetical protein